MKLIELLVKKLGGWPIDKKYHTFISQDDDGELWGFPSAPTMNGRGDWGINSGDGCYLLNLDVADDNKVAVITREQYEAALAASKPEWDGEGLPPVGVECEWQDKNTKAWLPVVIAYSSEWVTVVRELRPLKVGDAVECCINNFGEEERLQFRPIRSEADKKKEKVVDEIMSWMHYAGRAEVELIYDAIKSGKIVID